MLDVRTLIILNLCQMDFQLYIINASTKYKGQVS